MRDPSRTNQKLFEENSLLKQRIKELERSETERKRTEEELLASEVRLKAIYQGSPIPTFTWQKKGETFQLVDYNQAAKVAGKGEVIKYLGEDADEMYQDRPEILKNMHRCFTEKEVIQREKQSEHFMLGRTIIATYAFVPPDLIVVHAEDITERKQAEEKQKVSEQKYRTIFENAVEGIFQTTLEGRFRTVNPAMAHMHGFASPEEMITAITDIGKQLYVNPEDRVTYKKIINEGTIQGFETQHYRKDGSIIWVSINSRAVRDPTGKALYFEGTVGDITERKRTEEELLASEVRLKAIYQGSPIPTFTWQKKGETFELVDYNQAAKVAGKGEAIKYLGKTTDEMYQDRPEMLQDIHRCFTEKEVIQVEVQSQYFMPGRTVLATFAFVPPDLLMFHGQDITERKRTEEALKESEAKFRQIAEFSAIGIYLIQDGMFRYINQRFADIFGYSIEETVDKKGPPDLALPEDLPKVQENIRKRLSGENPILHYDFRITTKQNEIRYVEVFGSATAYQGKPAVIWTLFDITERKLVERSLVESEEKYRNVIENSLVGFYIVKDGLFRYVNRQFCEIHGYTYEEIVDKIGPLDLVHPDDREMLAENMRKRISGETDLIEYSFRTTRKDGRLINLKIIGATMIYEGERVVTGTILDITREKNLESQLLQSQKMEAIGTLTGGIAHDFNNILTVLVGYADLLKMNLNKGTLHIYVDQILSSSQKATDLVRSLLAFSRQQAIDLKPISLHSIVKGTGKLLKRLVTEDITIKTHLAAEDIIIMADANQIDQILFNLATNARDAMPQGGALTIETKAVELGDEFIRTHGYGDTGRYALLSISDTGMGMDEATREKIFDPFFTTKEVGKGTGLGLSTVYGIVQQHNGYITVYSEPKIGTTFHIYLPVANEIGKEDKPALGTVRGGNETILIGEDNEAVRNLISKILIEYGYTTVEAIDGADAVEQFKKADKIDLLILDSVMPKKNGREVYNEIHKIKPDIKVLFTSGYTRDVFLDKGIEDKGFNFLQKPISLPILLQKVREVLDDSQDSH